jgi:hypothetical protein
MRERRRKVSFYSIHEKKKKKKQLCDLRSILKENVDCTVVCSSGKWVANQGKDQSCKREELNWNRDGRHNEERKKESKGLSNTPTLTDCNLRQKRET